MKQAWKTFATRAVPRYTSYPTAADFTPAVTECDARAWARSVAPGERVSVYIHVPFCEKLCFYCGCATSVPNGYARIANYVAPLHREIDLWAEALAPNHGGIDHLHFGGGSPNALSPDDFKALADHACQAFGMSKDAEIAVEVDPRSMSPEFVDAMAAAGVSRVSFGVQTLAPKVQEAVGRIQPRELLVDGIRRLTGRVIGINTWKLNNQGEGTDGIGFAIPINVARSVFDAIIAADDKSRDDQISSVPRAISTAYLGVTIGDGYRPEAAQGAKVKEVIYGTAAEEAGLKAGDLITRIDGTNIDGLEDLRAALKQYEPGQKIKLTYTRNGEAHTIEVTLRD